MVKLKKRNQPKTLYYIYEILMCVLIFQLDHGKHVKILICYSCLLVGLMLSMLKY